MDCVYELDECRSYKHLLIKNLDLSQTAGAGVSSGSSGYGKQPECFRDVQVIDDFGSESSDLFSLMPQPKTTHETDVTEQSHKQAQRNSSSGDAACF